MASSGSTQPSPTLYISNLCTKVKKDDLKRSLYGLFSAHGKVIDVIARKGATMRGQAFVVFRDLQSATAARRREDGNVIFGKPLRISYAKTKSHATILQESGPEVLYRIKLGKFDQNASKITISQAERDNRDAARIKANNDKREREEDEEETGEADTRRAEKMRKTDIDADADAEEDMAIEEESDDEGPMPAANASTDNVVPPSNTLVVSNLPMAVETDMLAVLFQQFAGFSSVRILPVSQNADSRSAEVVYESSKDASTAKTSLDGFQMDRGVFITVSYASR